jgi:pterin-4a-carbinolamine dehydratase
MQSYSQMIDTTMSDSSLSHLQEKLKLPDGWQFKVLKLEEDLVLKTFEKTEAYVTQDEFQNTYQRMK